MERLVITVLLLFFSTASASAAEKCQVGQVRADLKVKFKFDRIDVYATSDTSNATTNVFAPTNNFQFCLQRGAEVWIREATSGKWFGVNFDERGNKVGLFVP